MTTKKQSKLGIFACAPSSQLVCTSGHINAILPSTFPPYLVLVLCTDGQGRAVHLNGGSLLALDMQWG